MSVIPFTEEDIRLAGEIAEEMTEVFGNAPEHLTMLTMATFVSGIMGHNTKLGNGSTKQLMGRLILSTMPALFSEGLDESGGGD